MFEADVKNMASEAQTGGMRRLSVMLLAAAVALAGCRGREQSVSKPDWPKTLQEATARIIAGMSEADKRTVREIAEEDLVKFHFGWGTGIRNSFGLWQGNKALLKSCGSSHPDDASGVIIHNVWKELRKKPGSGKKPGLTR